jgi:hypothetical protein
MKLNVFRELVRRALRMIAAPSDDTAVDRECACLGVLKFRQGTAAERAAFIASARERIENLKQQTFAPGQLGQASAAVTFEEGLIERLERGDVFTVPDVG